MPTIKISDTPADSECVTLVEAKAHLRVDISDDDLLIGALVTAARQDAEHKMGRTLVETVLELQLDEFPAFECIRLHKPPVQSVAHIKYYDSADTLQTLDASAYLLDGASEPARLVLASGHSWPATSSRPGAVQIRYVAGLPKADKGKVPEVIKAWIKLRLGTLYQHREEIAAGVSVAEIPFVNHLLDPHRVWSR